MSCVADCSAGNLLVTMGVLLKDLWRWNTTTNTQLHQHQTTVQRMARLHYKQRVDSDEKLWKQALLRYERNVGLLTTYLEKKLFALSEFLKHSFYIHVFYFFFNFTHPYQSVEDSISTLSLIDVAGKMEMYA